MPGPCLRRVRIATTARPNSAIIGGAGTSWPPLVLVLDEEEPLEDEDEELLLVLLVMSPDVVPG